jgi:CheY-like chemotaxis protein
MPCRVVVADAYPDSADTLAALLRLHGHAVWTAADGTTALRLARETGAHALFASLQLDGCDGFELARRLRASDPPCRARLVALTGAARPADRADCLAAGFDHHLAKPAEPAAVLAALAGLG